MSHGQVRLIRNWKPKWNESDKYVSFSIEMLCGDEYDIHLTPKQFYRILKSSKKRAKNNPEIGKFKGFFERLLDKIL